MEAKRSLHGSVNIQNVKNIAWRLVDGFAFLTEQEGDLLHLADKVDTTAWRLINDLCMLTEMEGGLLLLEGNTIPMPGILSRYFESSSLKVLAEEPRGVTEDTMHGTHRRPHLP
jgi:hypothetical protein